MHELPDDVLIEVGRFTLAAIELEDLTDSMCAFIHAANPRDNRRPIGRKIREARADLKNWGGGPDVARVDAWLLRASRALERRNALLHSVPLEVSLEDGSTSYALGEWPRNESDYFERELSVGGVRQVRDELTAAAEGWRDTLVLVHVLRA